MDETLAESARKALLEGDNRLKQGVDLAKVRESYARALELAQTAGTEERIRPIVELRLADLERLQGERTQPSQPEP